MCESTAYSTDGSLIMEDVLLIKVDGNQIIMTDILNQKKEITGDIKHFMLFNFK
jgi:hypothetical protein